MKLPKRLSDILATKQSFLDLQRNKLEASVVSQQSKLLDELITEIVPNLNIKNGVIQETVNNYKQIAALDKVYKTASLSANTAIFSQVTGTITKLGKINKSYFTTIIDPDMAERFANIVTKTDRLINLRIGLDGGKMVRGGFIESLFTSNPMGVDLKKFTSKAITGHMNIKDYTKGLKGIVSGVDKKLGGYERQFNRYAFDLYQQYDAAYNKTIGNELGFKYFIYQGGLVQDSRDFCREHNSHVYSVIESQSWPTWTPSQAIFITTFKQKDLSKVPGYLDYPGYDPLIDRGGYNCRHVLGWLPDSIAFKMRPDLKIIVEVLK